MLFRLIFFLSIAAAPLVAQDPAAQALVHILCPHTISVPNRGDHVISGLGAGFFIDKEGTLLTAYHVVQGCTQIQIHTSTSKECLNPKLVGYDEHTDLAELRCRPADGIVPVLPVGESFEPLPPPPGGGILYGHPNGKLNHREGAEFPFDRVLNSDRYFVELGQSIFAEPAHDLIEIEAEIDPGMSGGPLVLNGKAIGVLSGSQGPGGRQQGWAIPARGYKSLKPSANAAFESLPAITLLRDGSSSHAYLRVAMPEDRLQLLVESAAKLEELKTRLTAWQSQLGNPATLRSLQSSLATKRRVSPSDIEAIGQALWSWSRPGRDTRRFRKPSDFAWVELGPQYFGILGDDMMLWSRLVIPVIDERDAMKKILAGMERPSPADGRDDLRAAIREFIDLVAEEQTSVSGMLTRTDVLTKDFGVVAARRSALFSKRSGSAAAAYIDAVVDANRALEPVANGFLAHTDIYLRILDSTLKLNANPIILEKRLEP